MFHWVQLLLTFTSLTRHDGHSWQRRNCICFLHFIHICICICICVCNCAPLSWKGVTAQSAAWSHLGKNSTKRRQSGDQGTKEGKNCKCPFKIFQLQKIFAKCRQNNLEALQTACVCKIERNVFVSRNNVTFKTWVGHSDFLSDGKIHSEWTKPECPIGHL